MKEVGGSFTPSLRLSHRSIEKVLYIAVHLNPRTHRLADKLLKEERDDLFRRLDSPNSKGTQGGF